MEFKQKAKCFCHRYGTHAKGMVAMLKAWWPSKSMEAVIMEAKAMDAMQKAREKKELLQIFSLAKAAKHCDIYAAHVP